MSDVYKSHKEDNKIIVNKEEDIPYDEGCPYNIYDLYRNGEFVIDSEGKFGYKDSSSKQNYFTLEHIAVRLEFAIPKDSPEFAKFNRWDKMAYYAYVISPLTDKIEKVSLIRDALYLKYVISQELYDEIVAEYASGRTLEYELVLANFRGHGLQKVKFSITKE